MATTPMVVDAGATSAAAAALKALQQAGGSRPRRVLCFASMAAGAAVLGARLRTVGNVLV